MSDLPSAAPDRAIFVAFGATGDLMQRKLLPALYAISRDLPARPTPFLVLGSARHPLTDLEFRERAASAIAQSKTAPLLAARAWARRTLSYLAADESSPADFERLADRLVALEKAYRLPGNRVFYLALPSEAYPRVVQRIGESPLVNGPGWSRVVLEKPFGRDLESAKRLNHQLHRHFDERQIYRIDHYLGKETVQNLLVFRFANMLFESVWGRDRIEHVEITVAEDLGVEARSGYYDSTGALRDMVQSHLTQLLALTAMEVPASLDADQVRNEKVKVLRSLRPLRPEDVVRGQYVAGRMDGRRVRGYRSEAGVPRQSRTETFVALRLRINNWRWQGTDFLLRTGKRLPSKLTQIIVKFRKPPVWFFPQSDPGEVSANTLKITLQPQEGFELGIEIKRPGRLIKVGTERLHFRYDEAFGPLPDAYHTLLQDVLVGDQTLFVRADEVEESWRFYDPILRRPPRLRPYAAGTWGPKAAHEIARRRGHLWSTT